MTYREFSRQSRHDFITAQLRAHGWDRRETAHAIGLHVDSVHILIGTLGIVAPPGKRGRPKLAQPVQRQPVLLSVMEQQKRFTRDVIDERDGIKKGSTREDRMMILADKPKSRWM
jgi:hypothetical protein